MPDDDSASPPVLTKVAGEEHRSAEPAEPDDLTDAVRAAQGGSDVGFRTLYRALQPRLLRYLTVLVGADAEDVAGDVWLQVARDLSSFTGDGDGFRGWATTIARNRAMDHLRRAGRRPVIDSRLDGPPERPSDVDTAEAAAESISTDAALALIARLPHDQAEAVLLRAVLGFDAPSAARIVGKRPGAVRTAAHRGLRKLAGYLEETGVTHSPGSTLRKMR